VLGAEILQKALDEGLDTELFLDDLPEEFPPPGVESPMDLEESPEGSELEVDQEMMDDLGHLECEECLQQRNPPRGIPQDTSLTGPSTAPSNSSPFAPLSGAVQPRRGEEEEQDVPQPRRKVGKRKYLACSSPKLTRAKDGRKVWMSVCAYRQPPSQRVRMLAKIVSTNPAFRPRHLSVGGRRIPFTSDSELDKMLDTER
jgi:hypothetical protein